MNIWSYKKTCAYTCEKKKCWVYDGMRYVGRFFHSRTNELMDDWLMNNWNIDFDLAHVFEYLLTNLINMYSPDISR